MNIISRRQFLLLSAAVLSFPRESLAYTIIRQMQGTVWVNNELATLETLIQRGDTVTTGAGSSLVFVLDKDAYKLGPFSRLVLEATPQNNDRLINVMRLLTGALSCVFSPGEKREIATPTATLGIRGTGLYLQVDSQETYFCTCYGQTSIVTTGRTSRHKQINSTYHTASVISHDKREPLILPATLKGHTDNQLYYLESLVGREPPATFGSKDRLF